MNPAVQIDISVYDNPRFSNGYSRHGQLGWSTLYDSVSNFDNFFEHTHAMEGHLQVLNLWFSFFCRRRLLFYVLRVIGGPTTFYNRLVVGD